MIQIGQHVYTNLYSNGLGYISAIHGEQDPDSIEQVGGVMSSGGNAHFDIVFLNGHRSDRLPECILHGGQWDIREDIAPHIEVSAAIQRAEQYAQEKTEEANEAKRRHTEAAHATAADSSYAYLNQTEPDMHKRALINIRLELKKTFPGVKFSVTKDGYSTGNIKWEDGPTVKSVDHVVKKYQGGNFNGMEDIYDHNASPWNDTFGDLKYVFTSRSHSDFLNTVAIEKVFEEHAANLKGIDQPTLTDWNAGSLWQTQVPGLNVDLAALINRTRTDIACTPTPPATPAPDYGGRRYPVAGEIETHYHEKRGYDVFIVVMADRLETDEYKKLLARAKEDGGWYSRKWGTTPGGFAFKTRDAAESFMGLPLGPTPPPKGNGDKFRTMADKMQSGIDAKLADRPTNTPKRQQQAGYARMEGEHMQRTQTVLYALADSVPPELAHLTSKKAVHDMTKSAKGCATGYYDVAHCLGEPYHDSDTARAVWALLTPKTDVEQHADEVRKATQALQFANIPGYFPTPAALVDKMITAADLEPASLCLEPSAGSGAIADVLAPLCGTLHCLEVNHSLQKLLDLKGYAVVGGDFMEHTLNTEGAYDRIVMNPPFEKLQDIDHVLRAYQMLKPGGRLVSIMSPGPFFRTDKKSVGWREWFDAFRGTKEDIPAGTFKESGTGVASVMVVLDKEGS